MKKKMCHLEIEVLNGLKSGYLEPGLQEHLTSCPLCQDSAAIYKWMNRFRDHSLVSKPEMVEKKLPTAESIWEGAYSFYKPDKELVKKALRPLIFPRVLSYLAAVIVPLFLLFSYFPKLKEFIHSNPESNIILSSLVSIIKILFKAFPFILVPTAACLLTLIIFILLTGFQPRKT